MSTKIYNAYKFDKKYSMFEIMALFDPIRKQVEESAKMAMNETIELLEKYSFAPINEEIGKMMDNVTAGVIKKALRKELEELGN